VQTEKPSKRRTGKGIAVTKTASALAPKRTATATTSTIPVRSLVNVFQAPPLERIKIIRLGIPARRVGALARTMDRPKERLMEVLNLKRATINRKEKRNEALSVEESERLMGVESLIGQVAAMIGSNAPPDFDPAHWVASWLDSPIPALGGRQPASFMDTVEGQKYIANLLEMSVSGAYA
jgi:putative toxin-antitoxin system antitoxin component (TIGR02293 family)